MKRLLLFALSASSIVAPTAWADPPPLRVGPSGDYATIQAAIDAAARLAAPAEIRVATGRFVENLTLNVPEGRTLAISGGWAPGFATRFTPDQEHPADTSRNTVVQGASDGPVLHVQCSGIVRVQGFTLTGGGGARGAAGLDAWASGRGSIEVFDNTIWNNHTRVAMGGWGFAGVDLEGHARTTWRGNRFEGNSSEATTADAWANGGMSVFATGASFASLESNVFRHNQVLAPGQANVSGLSAEAQQDARVDLLDNVFLENQSISATGQGIGVVRLGASSGSFGGPGSPRLTVRRCQFLRNTPPQPSGWQVEAHAMGEGVLVVSDSVIAGDAGSASGTGIVADVREGGAEYLTNLTVTRQARVGVEAHGVGTVHLDNAILFENGTNTAGAMETANILEDDPLFFDADHDNFRLRPDSAAIDAGDSAAPEVGPWDVYQQRRVQGRAVDVGAAEYADGSQAELPCAVLWPTFHIGASTPVCRCVSNEWLREARCGVFDLPDLMLSLRIPLDWKAGETIAARWTVDPGPGVAGPFAMSAATEVGGAWVAQPWLAPAKPALNDGQPTLTTFQLKLPTDARAVLRTRLDYTRVGGAKGEPLDVELLLPKP